MIVTRRLIAGERVHHWGRVGTVVDGEWPWAVWVVFDDEPKLSHPIPPERICRMMKPQYHDDHCHTHYSTLEIDGTPICLTCIIAAKDAELVQLRARIDEMRAALLLAKQNIIEMYEGRSSQTTIGLIAQLDEARK